MEMKEYEEAAARARRMERIRRMQEEKQKQLMRRERIGQYAPYVTGAAALLLIVLLGIEIGRKVGSEKNIQISEGNESVADQEIASIAVNDSNVIHSIVTPEKLGTDLSEPEEESQIIGQTGNQLENPVGGQAASSKIYKAKTTENTLSLGDEIVSGYAVMIDLDNDQILAGKESKTRISPASMTKILTVLVAAEHLEDLGKLNDTFTITLEITDYGYIHDCSSAGFVQDEKVTVRDLFYGTVLPSGADAAVALATYIAGDQETFVEMMNDKLEQLGLSDTAHMTNCVGVYDEDHYCTVYDMAMILEAAVDNELCKEVLSAHTYTTSKTEHHPEGINLSNWFLRRIEDKDTGGEVVCGKTGFVNQSRNCAASYGVDNMGKEYICVTADASSVWRCIEDHAALYKRFAEI